MKYCSHLDHIDPALGLDAAEPTLPHQQQLTVLNKELFFKNILAVMWIHIRLMRIRENTKWPDKSTASSAMLDFDIKIWKGNIC